MCLCVSVCTYLCMWAITFPNSLDTGIHNDKHFFLQIAITQVIMTLQTQLKLRCRRLMKMSVDTCYVWHQHPRPCLYAFQIVHLGNVVDESFFILLFLGYHILAKYAQVN